MFKVALSCAVAASGILLYGGAASSRTIVVDETRGRYVECYNKEYVPARVLVNTRGRRVRGEYHEWRSSDEVEPGARAGGLHPDPPHDRARPLHPYPDLGLSVAASMAGSRASGAS